jgi:hypothetical protein
MAMNQVPKGRLKIARHSYSAVPPGLYGYIDPKPSDKSLGYFHIVPDGTKERAADVNPSDKSLGYFHGVPDGTRGKGLLRFQTINRWAIFMASLTGRAGRVFFGSKR